LYADGALKIAADRTGGVAVAIRQVHTASGNVSRLFAVAFQINGTALVLRKLRPISSLSEDVVNFGVTTIKTATGGSTGRFRILWLNDADKLRTRVSTQPTDPVWGTTDTVVTFPARGYVFPSSPAVDGSWAALNANIQTGLRAVVIAVPLGELAARDHLPRRCHRVVHPAATVAPLVLSGPRRRHRDARYAGR
jgi:hypothetical protein